MRRCFALLVVAGSLGAVTPSLGVEMPVVGVPTRPVKGVVGRDVAARSPRVHPLVVVVRALVAQVVA